MINAAKVLRGFKTSFVRWVFLYTGEYSDFIPKTFLEKIKINTQVPKISSFPITSISFGGSKGICPLSISPFNCSFDSLSDFSRLAFSTGVVTKLGDKTVSVCSIVIGVSIWSKLISVCDSVSGSESDKEITLGVFSGFVDDPEISVFIFVLSVASELSLGF